MTGLKAAGDDLDSKLVDLAAAGDDVRQPEMPPASGVGGPKSELLYSLLRIYGAPL